MVRYTEEYLKKNGNKIINSLMRDKKMYRNECMRLRDKIRKLSKKK